MKLKVLGEPEANELLLFFSGWGMDERPFAHLTTDGLRVLYLYDYHDLTLPSGLEAKVIGGRLSLVAWSLGVFAAAQSLYGMDLPIEDSMAINGTLLPISEDEGIPPEIFEGTIAGWGESNRRKFNRRMCGDKSAFLDFEKCSPGRGCEEQKEELVALREQVLCGGEVAEDLFDRAVVGDKDRIFPASAQLASWDRREVKALEIDAPHYLFGNLKSWREVMSLASS